jgi:hypothetical protein
MFSEEKQRYKTLERTGIIFGGKEIIVLSATNSSPKAIKKS